jgi:ribosomal protein S18 acetylase RimI-like enzyme
MIKNIDTKVFSNAFGILKIQAPSYRVEGALMGFYGIPAMKETVESILNSKDTYEGFYENNQLAGFIAYNINGDTVEITKLVINPPHFRKGMATQLIKHLFEINSNSKLCKVSTGTKNTPAITLYKKFGFYQVGQKEVAPSVFITQFEKTV